MTAVWQRPKCESNSCAEVKIDDTKVYVRSSMNHQLVTFTLEEWNMLKAAIKDGEFDQ